MFLRISPLTLSKCRSFSDLPNMSRVWRIPTTSPSTFIQPKKYRHGPMGVGRSKCGFNGWRFRVFRKKMMIWCPSSTCGAGKPKFLIKIMVPLVIMHVFGDAETLDPAPIYRNKHCCWCIDGIWVISTMLGIVQQRRRFRTRPNIRIACCNFLGRQAWLVVSKLLLFSLVACPSPSDPTVVGVCIPSLMLVSSSTFAD